MFYEDPKKVGERLGWKLYSTLLPTVFKRQVVPIYEELKKTEDIKCLQLAYTIESSFPEIDPDEWCNYLVFFIENAFCVYSLDTKALVMASTKHCTDIFIKKGPVENYLIEIFFSGIDEEGNNKQGNFLLQTIPRFNDKLERQFGKELGTPNQFISYLRSLPGYKSSL